MPNYTTLLGVEEVRKAGAQIQSAADQIHHAVSSLDEILQQFSYRVEGWITRLEAAGERIETALNNAQKSEGEEK